ncbi:formimidoylglutamate deiminase [Janthinobacterium sp. PC23-8]|uniref:formimidoylglutamate deiminase n=1 Tax=Janthinobacterium sp. PC23-8 TaxID=2012679 RepID=UPI000B964A67|nr:formimidoylglutamate deiminase [Janthinobacterium sp. PC23-8]OYO30988.1 formimidoylglutamate deiminase [Janthinobacterium sp. PC23-8]
MGAALKLFARHALLPGGWRRDVLLAWDADGDLTSVIDNAAPPDGVELAEYVVPGMVNLHSHAFQRALGGMTEKAGAGPDSFWTWRELMYRFAGRIAPEQIEAIAAQLFAECLRHGYTAVCEFHYLQRDAAGALYARPAETAETVIAAARASGIGITMLPVLYSHAGFGAQPLTPEQARFRTDAGDVLRIVEALEVQRDGQVEVGFAPHSLRAAPMDQVAQVLAAVPVGRPIHIHIAEQQAEVDQCLVATSMRPVQYLYDQFDVDARWCLVHATHLSHDEIVQLAASGAVAGLCPTTEANLGDGLFPLPEFIAAGGRFGIGSDSHVSQSPVEELRWLEYGQRLQRRQRNIAATPAQPQVGDYLWQSALQGGAQAAGRKLGALAVGCRADLLVLDDAHPNLCAVAVDEVLGSLLFCGNDNLVRDVLCGGRWQVRGGRHVAQDAIASAYKCAVARLRSL